VDVLKIVFMPPLPLGSAGHVVFMSSVRPSVHDVVSTISLVYCRPLVLWLGDRKGIQLVKVLQQELPKITFWEPA